jgi:molecular chaperone HtpG
MDGIIDAHFINSLEQKLEKTHFTRVDADTADKLIKKDDVLPSKLTEDQQKSMKELIEKQVDKDKYTIQFESLSETEQPMMIIQPEFMRRMKDMSLLGGGMSYMADLPDHYNLVINSNHPLISRIIDESDEEKKQSTVKYLFDLALLGQNLLKGKDLNDFIKRSMQLV